MNELRTNLTVKNGEKVPYTVIANSALQDRRLTNKARGMLVLLLSYADRFRFTESFLCEAIADGRDGVRAQLRELESFGYAKRVQTQGPDGKYGNTILFISDKKIYINDEDVSPLTEKPSTANPQQINNKYIYSENRKDEKARTPDITTAESDTPKGDDTIVKATKAEFILTDEKNKTDASMQDLANKIYKLIPNCNGVKSKRELNERTLRALSIITKKEDEDTIIGAAKAYSEWANKPGRETPVYRQYRADTFLIDHLEQWKQKRPAKAEDLKTNYNDRFEWI